MTESHTGTGAYDLEYVYDDGGNRTAKIDYANDRLTEYHYDIEDPSVYESNNNRLEYYEVYDTSGQSQALLSTTWYYYEDDEGLDYGNPTRIVTKPEASAVYESVCFGYGMAGWPIFSLIEVGAMILSRPRLKQILRSSAARPLSLCASVPLFLRA